MIAIFRSMFGQSDFDKLAPHVDGFSLMTYDYSSPGRLVYNIALFVYMYMM